MTAHHDVEGLAAKLTEATGPDRELDVAIWLAFTPGATRRDLVIPANEQRRGWTIDETRDASGRLIVVPAYTASLDAAMTLVPEGWLIADLFQRNCRLPNWIWKAQLWHPEADANVSGIARNADVPAIALCIAALRSHLIGTGNG
jgi:hypothetical protein